MPFYARAWRKLLRHGGKTLFLGMVFFVAAASGSGVVAFVTKMWGETLLVVLGEELSPSLTLEQVGLLFMGGGAVVLVASIFAMLPMLLRQPAILLSEMEE